MDHLPQPERRKSYSLDLRALILIFVLLSVLATLANSLYTAYRVQRDALVTHALESNSAYAAKVASSVGAFLRSAQSHLDYSATELGKHWGSAAQLRNEAVRLQAQDADFNSIAIADADGKVLEFYPDALQIIGSTLHSEVIAQTHTTRRPHLSTAYVSAAGNLVVFMSQPIFDSSGAFVGTVGGSIYLRKQSALHTVISNHFHHEGTFAFVADSKRQLLYHPEPERIGETLGWSKTVDAALAGKSGSMEVDNYKGVPMLAGYAQVADANWAVVVQQPRALTLAPLKRLTHDVVLGMLPAGVLGLFFLWIGAALIARPLKQLAGVAEQLAAPKAAETLEGVRTWYRDASAIRQALLTSVHLLNQKLGRLTEEAQSDPLTGLANRRAMTALLTMLEQAGQEYSLLALDIDHFKRVNDTFGHDAGDVALQSVSDILKEHSRTGDLACRAGGEEFVLVLPNTSLQSAVSIAERIREAIAVNEVPHVGRITMSIGVATGQKDGPSFEAVLKLADDRLYQAKDGGRNRVQA